MEMCREIKISRIKYSGRLTNQPLSQQTPGVLEILFFSQIGIIFKKTRIVVADKIVKSLQLKRI